MGWLQDLFSRDNRPIPDYWSAYLQLFNNKIPGSGSIKNLRFVVLDTETTGFDRDKKILSMGAIAVVGGEI